MYGTVLRTTVEQTRELFTSIILPIGTLACGSGDPSLRLKTGSARDDPHLAFATA